MRPPRRKTNDEFIKEVKELVGDEYKFLEDYKNNRTKIKVEHLECGNVYGVRPKDFIKGNRCPKCALKKSRICPNKYNNDFKRIMGDNYELMSTYTHSREPITFKHLVCGNIATVKYAENLYHSNIGCLPCTNKGFTKTHEEFEKEVRNIHGDSYELMGRYKNNKTYISVKHKKCGKVSYIEPGNLLRNKGRCRYCSQSIGEVTVKKSLESLGVDYVEQKTFEDLRSDKDYPYRYDFYVERYNLLIEYHGRQHYIPIDFIGGEAQLKKQQETDRIKRDYALENGYKYLEIHYEVPLDKIENIIYKKIISVK